MKNSPQSTFYERERTFPPSFGNHERRAHILQAASSPSFFLGKMQALQRVEAVGGRKNSCYKASCCIKPGQALHTKMTIRRMLRPVLGELLELGTVKAPSWFPSQGQRCLSFSRPECHVRAIHGHRPEGFFSLGFKTFHWWPYELWPLFRLESYFLGLQLSKNVPTARHYFSAAPCCRNDIFVCRVYVVFEWAPSHPFGPEWQWDVARRRRYLLQIMPRW